MCFISNFPPSLIESDGAPPDGTPTIVIHSFNIILMAFCDVMVSCLLLPVSYSTLFLETKSMYYTTKTLDLSDYILLAGL